MQNISQKHSLVLLGLLSFIFIIVYSCTKIDISAGQSVNNENFTQKFFATKTAPSTTVAAVIEKLKTENERTGFVNKLPKDCGLPVWDKLVITPKPQRSSSFGADGLDIIIVPLTITTNTLSSLIIIEEKDDGTFTINCYTANNYLYNLCNTTGATVLQAEKLMDVFMVMENIVYGTTKFYHIPLSMYTNRHTVICADNKKMIEIRAVSDSTSQSNFVQLFCWDEQNGNCNCTGSCDWCGYCTDTHCMAVGGGGSGGNWPMSDPPEGGGGGGTGGPGGGGNPRGCPFGGSWYNLVPPVGGCENPPPPPPTPPQDTCSLFIERLQSDTNFINRMKYLNSSAALGAPNELGYEIRDISQYNSNTYIPASGSVNEPTIDWSFPANTFTEGLIHSHYADLNSIFSPRDVILLARLFIKNHAKDSNNLFFAMTSQYGVPNLIKVGNPAIFRAFCEKIVGSNGDDAKKCSTLEKKWTIK